MKSLFIAITAGALTMGSMGQGIAPTAPAMAGSELNGTDLVAELNKSLNSKKAKLGDPVKATLTQDVLSHGKIVLRRGSKLIGHVTEAKARSKEDRESRLGMIFDKAVLKGGQEIDFSAALRALAPPVRYSAVDKPDMMAPPITGAMQSGSAQPLSSGPGSAGSRTAGSPGTTSNPASQSSRMAQYASATPSSAVPEASLMGGGSRGVFGMPGLRLGPAVKGQPASVISSISHDVKLDSGTQMILQVTGPVR